MKPMTSQIFVGDVFLHLEAGRAVVNLLAHGLSVEYMEARTLLATERRAS